MNEDGVIGDTDTKILSETSDYILSLNASNQYIEVFARDGLFHQLFNEDGTPVYQGDRENHIYKAIEQVNGELQLLVHNPTNDRYHIYNINEQWRIDYLKTVNKKSDKLIPFNLDFASSISIDDHQFVEQQGDLYLIKDNVNSYSTLSKDGFVRSFLNKLVCKINQI